METAARAAPHDLSGVWELQETDGAKGFLKDTRAKWDKKTGRLDVKVLTAQKERSEYTQTGNVVQIRTENLKRGTFTEESFAVDGLKHHGEWTDGARPWFQWSWDEDGWAVQVATAHSGRGGCLRTRVGMLDANTMIKTVQAYNSEQDEPLSQNMLKRTYTRVAPLGALEIPRVLQTAESLDGNSENRAQPQLEAGAKAQANADASVEVQVAELRSANDKAEAKHKEAEERAQAEAAERQKLQLEYEERAQAAAAERQKLQREYEERAQAAAAAAAATERQKLQLEYEERAQAAAAERQKLQREYEKRAQAALAAERQKLQLEYEERAQAAAAAAAAAERAKLQLEYEERAQAEAAERQKLKLEYDELLSDAELVSSDTQPAPDRTIVSSMGVSSGLPDAVEVDVVSATDSGDDTEEVVEAEATVAQGMPLLQAVVDSIEVPSAQDEDQSESARLIAPPESLNGASESSSAEPEDGKIRKRSCCCWVWSALRGAVLGVLSAGALDENVYHGDQPWVPAMFALVVVSVTFAGTRTTRSCRLLVCTAIPSVFLAVVCYYTAGCGSLDCAPPAHCYTRTPPHCACSYGYYYSHSQRTCERDQCHGVYCGAHGTCSSGVCACTHNYEGERCEFAPKYVITRAKNHGLNGAYHRSGWQTCNRKPVYYMGSYRLFQPSGSREWAVGTSDAAASCESRGLAFSRAACSGGPSTCATWEENHEPCAGAWCYSPMDVTARNL